MGSPESVNNRISLLSKPIDLRSDFRYALTSPVKVSMAYLIAIAIAEATIVFIEPRVGMILHGLILIVILIHASLIVRGRLQKFLTALAMAPLIRLLSLSLPLPDYPFIYWYMVVGLPLLIGTFIAARVTRTRMKMLGINWRALPVQIIIGLTGLAFGFIEYLILRPEPLIAEFTWQSILVPALILLIFTGFLEELIFRGLMQYSSIRSMGRFGLIFVAAIFAILHFGYRSIVDVIFVFMVALFFGLVVARTGSIFGVTLSHGLTNISLFLVFPFLVAIPTSSSLSAGTVIDQDNAQIPIEFTSTPGIVGPAILAPPPAKLPTATEIIFTPTATYAPTETQTTPTDTDIPSSASPTSTPTSCQHPAGWVRYIVRPGDTLYNLSLRYGITQNRLRSANCLSNNTLSVGQLIYVPFVYLPNTPPAPIHTATFITFPTATFNTPPATATQVPATSIIPPTATQISPPSSTTVILHTDTPLPPTEAPTTTPMPPTEPPEPTSTPVPATNPPPTSTSVPPTNPPPPTSTPLPPVDTPTQTN